MILKRVFLCVFLVLLYFNAARANVSSSEKTIVETITRRYANIVNKVDLEASLYKASLSLPNKTSRNIIANVFVANKVASEKDALNTTSTQLFKNALTAAKNLNQPDLQLWATTQYAFYLYTYRKYEETFPLFMACINILDQIDVDKIISPAETYKKIGYFLMTVEDHEKAEQYLLRAKHYATPNSGELAAILDNLGINSFKKNQLLIADHYFKEALEVAESSKDELRYGKVLGNMATVKLKQKQYGAAIELLNRDVAISKKINNTPNTIYAMVLLGKAYLAKNEIIAANEMLHLAQVYAQSKTYLQSSDYEINTLILEIAKKIGNERDELQARRKLEVLSKTLAHLDGKDVIMKMRWGMEKEKLELSIAAEKAKGDKETLLKLLALFGCVILLMLILLIVRTYRKEIKAKATAYDEKIKRLSIDKERSEEKLIENHQTLESYKTYLNEKNTQIKALEMEMVSIKKSALPYAEKYKDKIEALLQSHLLDNNVWTEFKRAFIEEHPQYYQALMQNFRGLTDANLRIIFLMKLEMNNVEIARILGLTLEAVKKAKQRLKKKYGDDYSLLFVDDWLLIKKPDKVLEA